MKAEILNQLTIDIVKEIVVVADSLLTNTAWDDLEYPTEESYYTAVLNRLKEKAK